MNSFFSWLKNSANDPDRLSNAAAIIVCISIFAGTLTLVATTDTPNESAGASPATNFTFRMADFHIAKKIAETETAPEEMPPAIDVPEVEETTPEPPTPEPPPPQKISDDAIREISTPQPEIPPEQEKEPEPKAEEPPPTEEPPPEEKELEQKKPEIPPQQAAPEDTAPPPAEVVSPPKVAPTEFSPAGKRTLYGTLADAVRRKKFYPKAARRTGRTGTVLVRVEISTAGKIASFSVDHGNAHATLEHGAEETFRRVAESFSVPADFRKELPAVFVVPVVYELK